jgi:hypothetical protein
MFNLNLTTIQTDNHLEITLCGKGSCKCPSIEMDVDSDHILIGGEEEGYTTFTKEQFSLLIDEIKHGTFDKYL